MAGQKQDDATCGFYVYSGTGTSFSQGWTNRNRDPKQDSKGTMSHYDYPSQSGYDGFVTGMVINDDNTGIVYSQGDLTRYQYTPSFAVLSKVPASCVTTFGRDAQGNPTISFEVTAGNQGVPGPVLMSEDAQDVTSAYQLWQHQDI